MIYHPRPYQRRAIEHVMTRRRCALFLDMGLGKSSITLTAIERMISMGDIERVLVIAPAKVTESTWSDEAALWDHLQWLNVLPITGSSKQRERKLQRGADVEVISRDNIPWLARLFPDLSKRYDMIVVDELTSFKNSGSQRFKALRSASALVSRVVGLTGTPSPNGLRDLWGQLYIIDRGERLGPSKTKFERQYFHLIEHNHIVIKAFPLPGSQKEIEEKLSDICLTMLAEEYNPLPDIMIIDDKVALDTAGADAYARMERDQVAAFVEETKGAASTVVATSAAALMNKLSQIANGAVYDDQRNVIRIHDCKLHRLEEIVEGAGEPVLVFYQYLHDATAIEKALGKGRKLRRYEGADDLRDWNEGKIDVLLAHPASCAYGLNMQHGGRYIVWYSTGWNLELYSQANARLHRQGQTKPVTVYNLIASGTVDERMASALRGKASTQEKLMKNVSELVKKYSENG